MSSEYDIIVVGGGIGGLTAAIQLATAGKKVAIFEKNPVVGGCCVSFKRKGFMFDAGVHALGGVGNPRSFVGRFIEGIGFDPTKDFIQYEPCDRFFIRDEKYEVPQDLNSFINNLTGRFPKEKESISEFFKLVLKIFRRRADWGRDIYKEYMPYTYQEILDRFFDDAILKQVLAGFTGYLGYHPGELSFIAICLLLGSNFYECSYYPRKGMGHFSDTLAEKFKSYNGRLFLSEEVVCITSCEQGYRVETGKGNTYITKWVISDISLNEFCRIFPPAAEYFHPGLKESLSMFVLYLGIDIDKAVLEGKSGWYFSESGHEDYYRINIPTQIDESIAPSGMSIVEILLPLPVDDENFKIWVNDKDRKKVYRDRLLDRAEKVIPGLKDRIVTEESASPATFRRYTGSKNGAVYGLAMRPDQMVQGRPRIMTDIPNLVYVGHWSMPGAGIASVMYSGLIASMAI